MMCVSLAWASPFTCHVVSLADLSINDNFMADCYHT